MSITIAQICDAIESTLGAATGIKRGQSYDELGESIQDTPLLQVYPETLFGNATGNTDRSSFRGGIRQTEVVIYADLYAQQRRHMGEDMKKLVNGVDAIVTVIQAQDTKPYFGLDGIKAFSWRGERVTFIYGDSQQPYVGMRFYFTLRVF
jgi:hypothetical protein